MNKLFSEIAKGLTWVGKELSKVADWLPKVVTVVDDVEVDATKVLPELVIVVEDVDKLALAAVQDGGSVITKAESLTAAIVMAATQDGLNIASDSAVVAAFEAFIADVTSTSSWSDLLSALKQLVTDYDKLGATAKAEIEKLESDAK